MNNDWDFDLLVDLVGDNRAAIIASNIVAGKEGRISLFGSLILTVIFLLLALGR